MTATTFAVSPEVKTGGRLETVDYVRELRVALRRPIEATWLPRGPLIACDDEHALLSAIKISFYKHLPLKLSPDAIWLTLVRGFALHINENSERFRHQFVAHADKEEIVVMRPDFVLGAANPWPEVFDAFSDQIAKRTGGLSKTVEANFSTTGRVERAVSHLMAMETFKAYFEYVLWIGCGIPSISLTGTAEDWQLLRQRVQQFAEYELEDWIEALDPILAQFEQAKAGNADVEFWKSMFRFNSGSGPAVMTGWVNVLFPYFKDAKERLYKNPFLADWRERLAIDDAQQWRDRHKNPQGVGIAAVPSCFTTVPLSVRWLTGETKLRLVGGLLGVYQDEQSLEVEPECGWVVVYEEPVDPLSEHYQWIENRQQAAEQAE